MNILIKMHADIEPPSVIANGDWIDLRAAEDYYLDGGQVALINLGISMKLPEGYEAHLAPRSSTYSKWGIIQTNSIGIIDNSYCGDNDIWKMAVMATRVTKICKGDRICQFRIVPKQPEVQLIQVDHLSDTNRGGFGSTGTN